MPACKIYDALVQKLKSVISELDRNGYLIPASHAQHALDSMPADADAISNPEGSGVQDSSSDSAVSAEHSGHLTRSS